LIISAGLGRERKMRIKNLYMQGFKSFMDKLNLQIPPGVSAFVGPNGCGKSNIVDAIRWVMGEQSPKQLRGRLMEDLIFSGAGPLRPLGMAEVTLTLGNSIEPHETNEISITRRLYRSGEAEYLINNSPCRLKDIHDLFMGTGLGNRAYAIIAQGEIGSIIEQKPEETRMLLEEAAGISKYKARREASLRKIALTKENLRRVEDLLFEIKREMNSLKRQAGKARRFKEVSSEIRHLNLVLSAHNYEELQKEKDKREEAISQRIAKEKEVEGLLSECEHAIEVRNRELVEKEKTLSALKESVFSLREEYRKSEDALQHLSADQQTCRRADIRLSKEKDELREKAKGFQSEIEKISSRVGELQKSLEEISSVRSHTEASLRNNVQQLDSIKDALEKERTNLIELATEEARSTGDIRHLSDMIDHVEIRKKELEKESRACTQRFEKQSALLREKKGERQGLLNHISSLETAIREQEARQKELEEVKRKKETLKSKADSALNLLRAQLKTIRDLIENYEGYRSGVQMVMNTYGPKTTAGGKVLGVLADFIKVEPEFEAAVEAVLDERLQYVVVARHEDGKEAVEYLRSKAMGRSYFLPLEEFKLQRPPGNAKGEHNGLPLLRDHISVPDRFKLVVESLLGNAALVDSLSEALSAWKNGIPKQTLVTPEGDLVDERGIIIGGSLGKDSIGLLRRRRKEQELRNKIEDKEKLIAALQSEIGGIAFHEAKLNGLIEQLQCKEQGYVKQSEAIEKDIFLLENESEQLIKQSQYILNQLEALGQEGKEKGPRLATLEEKLSRCHKRKEEVQRVVSEREAEAEELENKVNDSKEELSRILLEFNQYKEEERSLVRERGRLEQFVGDMGERISKVQEEMQSNRTQYESSLVKEKELKGALEVSYQEQKRLEDEASESEETFGILRQGLREKEKEAALLRERIREIRDEINEERLREAEVDFQTKGILSQVSRDMGIDFRREYRRYLDKDFSRPHYEQKLKDNTRIKERIGEVNLLAISDYENLKERYEFIKAQEQDLLSSIDSLNNAIRRINRISKQRFLSTFRKVDEKLKEVFPILFSGGKARLRLIDETLPLETGVLVEVQPSAKRLVHMGLLSGGEKALSAAALLFAIYLVKASPFIIMDEADAPLDEANTDRFNDLLREIRKSSQVIMVTHNLRSMQVAERLYGVTMDKGGVSKIVSVNLEGYQ
jgi:chromosome segregation protein